MMVDIFFFISLVSILMILGMCIVSLISEKLRVFPPPDTTSVQYYMFWTFFRAMFFSLVLLSLIEFNIDHIVNNLVYFCVGSVLFLVGFGFATYFSIYLGWKNAHGERDGLVVSGVYRWSRNPVYVSSILGMAGWSLMFNSIKINIILAFWAGVYALAPFIEERWLTKIYGKEYLSYKCKTARYFGVPKQTKQDN